MNCNTTHYRANSSSVPGDPTTKGVRVIGVSTDESAAQKKFEEKYKLPFTLLADPDRKVIGAFGVPMIPGKPYATRQAFLFKDGVLVWRDLKASTDKQAADVLKVVAGG